MKLVRFVFFILLCLFVYWAAAYDTFSNFITNLTDDAQPMAEVIDTKTNEAIDQLNATDMTLLIPYLNKALFICSCVALVLSALYLVVFRKAAKRRNTYSEISTYVFLSAVCVLLTFFKQDTANWWVIPTIPIISFVLCYPLLYLPHYRYFRWVFAFFFDILVVFTGFVYVILCVTDAPFWVTIISFVITLLALWYTWTHRKFDSCEKCKKYIEDIRVSRTIDKTDISYKDIDTEVATGYDVTTTYDKYGHKVDEKRKARGWQKVKGTQKIIKKYYTDLYRCPYCGHEHTKSDVIESTKQLGYKQREEPTGTYRGDIVPNE